MFSFKALERATTSSWIVFVYGTYLLLGLEVVVFLHSTWHSGILAHRLFCHKNWNSNCPFFSLWSGSKAGAVQPSATCLSGYTTHRAIWRGKPLPLSCSSPPQLSHFLKPSALSGAMGKNPAEKRKKRATLHAA